MTDTSAQLRRRLAAMSSRQRRALAQQQRTRAVIWSASGSPETADALEAFLAVLDEVDRHEQARTRDAGP